MATTIIESTLRANINEDIAINGVSYGASIPKSFLANGKVIQRIMAIPFESGTGFTNILNLGALDVAGQIIAADYTYFRITNTDDSLDLALQFYIGAAKSFFIRLNPLCSFLLMGNCGADVKCDGSLDFAMGNITAINGKHEGIVIDNDIYIEYVAVTKGGVVAP